MSSASTARSPSRGDFPQSIAGSARVSLATSPLVTHLGGDSSRLRESPSRSRPPITFNNASATQSWVITEGGESRRNSLGHSGTLEELVQIDEDTNEEDPFSDYMEYESDTDYLSDDGNDSRKQVRRQASQTRRAAPTQDLPNSPSPCTPRPRSRVYADLKTAALTDAPSVYSRPSWRQSQFPQLTSMPPARMSMSRNTLGEGLERRKGEPYE